MQMVFQDHTGQLVEFQAECYAEEEQLVGDRDE